MHWIKSSHLLETSGLKFSYLVLPLKFELALQSNDYNQDSRNEKRFRLVLLSHL